jgi:translation initiation factor IF-2
VAKKRVHQIAKEQGLTSKEVLAALHAAGVGATTASSSVEEEVALAALRKAKNGPAAAPAEQAPSAQAKPPAPPAKPPEGQGQRPRPQVGGKPKGGSVQRPQGQSGASAKAGGERRQEGGPSGQRPVQRPPRPGDRLAHGRRRVVIDSQASRRPGPGPQAAAQSQRRGRRGRRRRPFEEEAAPQSQAPAVPQGEEAIRINSGATVREVAEHLGITPAEAIKRLMALGEMATLTQTLSDEAIELLAEELGKAVEIVHGGVEEEQPQPEDDPAKLKERPPVVTIMGHVDHGKTSLLDAIRETEVARFEAGGITQHIGAYQVVHAGKPITFIDTPGHEAFTAMRARGAKVTDIAVIVVAADDGVKPQTEEAIDHARAAGVPIVVAVNKIDKPEAQPERVRGELAQRGLQPVEWGGEVEFVDVSAKTKEGLDQLLETIQVVAELLELRANPDALAQGTVIESKLDPGRGPVVTVLVQRGTLRVGDALVAGVHHGRVRAMLDWAGQRLKEAGPGQPVEVLGFSGVPEAGEAVRAVENERRARQLAQERLTRQKAEALARRSRRRVSLEEVLELARSGRVQELNLVVKADVAGSLEALEDEIAKLPQSEVAVQIVHSGVGGVTESDVNLASASNGLILAFNVRPLGEAAKLAERLGVEIRTYSVIYQAIEDLKSAMEGLLEPQEVEEQVGAIEVRALFRASRVGTIAGCYVEEGVVRRGAKVRVVRDGTIVADTRVASLRRFNDDVNEVQSGLECGIVLENFHDLKVGDRFEVYETKAVERQLA